MWGVRTAGGTLATGAGACRVVPVGATAHPSPVQRPLLPRRGVGPDPCPGPPARRPDWLGVARTRGDRAEAQRTDPADLDRAESTIGPRSWSSTTWPNSAGESAPWGSRSSGKYTPFGRDTWSAISDTSALATPGGMD